MAIIYRSDRPAGDANNLTPAEVDNNFREIEQTAAQALQEAQGKEAAGTAQGLVEALETAISSSFTEVAAGKNLFNINAKDRLLDTYLTETSGSSFGQLTANTTYNTSGFIRVVPGTNYVSSSSFRSVVFYNVNKAPVSGLTGVSKFTVPSGIAYLRFCIAKTNWINTLQLERGANPTTYEAYVPKLQVDLTQTELNNSIAGGKNLFNPNHPDCLYGYYLIGDNQDRIAQSATYNITHYIPVKPDQVYSLSFKHVICWYDANKVLISYSLQQDGVKTQTSPANAAYLKCTVVATQWQTFQVEQFSSPTAFEPFKPVYELPDGVKVNARNLVGNLPSDTIRVFLPSEICVAQGRTIEIYHSQAAWCGNVNDYHFFWDGIGNSFERKWSFTATATNLGNYSLTLKVYDVNMQLVATATTTVKSVTNVITNPFNLNCVGDSLSSGKAWLGELVSLSGNKINLVGTRTIGGYATEGRSGVSVDFYIGDLTYSDAYGTVGNDGRTKDRNPFWNPNTNAIDFNYYKSNYNLTIDKMTIWLGTNSLNVDSTFAVSGLKKFVDAIRATGGATLPIFLFFTIYKAGQNALGRRLSTDGYVASNAWDLQEKLKVFNQMVGYNEAFKGYSNLYFVPLSLCHDTEYNHINTSAPVNPRASQTEAIAEDATHPQNQGYLQIADVVFSTIAAHQ